MKMDNYYVVFLGELKDDQKIQSRFAKHYNKWCDIINAHIEELNDTFDRQWKGKPIQDYWENKEYRNFMEASYRDILKRSGMDKDLFLDYEIDNELQLFGIKRHGKRKGQTISFVLKRA